MNLRTLLAKGAETLFAEEDPVPTPASAAQSSRKGMPNVQRTTAGLEPYTGPWGYTQAAHLLRRTTFGATHADINTLLGTTASGAVDLLMTPQVDESSVPLCIDSKDIVAVGTTWVNALFRDPNPAVKYNPTNTRISSLKSWWIGLMLNQQLSIREKMVLFWHNHFVTEMAIVADPRFSFQYLTLLRTNATGNFKDLTRMITLDGAMLRYLNGNTNTASSPNENYGRELQELFTIGKGPEVAPGDYTNYTEADVKAAARVLTGWKDATNPDGTVGATTSAFFASRHDTTNKQFSQDYGNTIITGGTDGLAEINALLDMIFSEPATASFICRELYRWFVYYVIDTTTEANIIAPMATLLMQNNFSIAPVLSTLLKSAHFFDPVNIGCMIKNPIDHLVGVCRQFGVAIPILPVTTQYGMWNLLWTQSQSFNMNIGDPPNVAGWPAYYQVPEFHKLWINSDTLPKRGRFTDTLIRSGYTVNGMNLMIDPIAFVRTLSNPSDPNVIINESAQYLFPIDISANQQAFLKDVLLPSLPDYEWTNEWVAYTADPTNATKLSAVQSRLQALYSFMMEMPEFQLS